MLVLRGDEMSPKENDDSSKEGNPTHRIDRVKTKSNQFII